MQDGSRAGGKGKGKLSEVGKKSAGDKDGGERVKGEYEPGTRGGERVKGEHEPGTRGGGEGEKGVGGEPDSPGP